MFSHKGSSLFLQLMWNTVLSCLCMLIDEQLHIVLFHNWWYCRPCPQFVCRLLPQFKFHAGHKSLVRQASACTTVWIIIYQIASYLFFFSWYSMLYTFIDTLKLWEAFVERHEILHVLSLCILFSMITFAVPGSKFSSQTPSFKIRVILAAISQEQ